MKYTIAEFSKQFPTDQACLDYLFQRRYPGGGRCDNCKKEDCFYPVKGRKSYACSWCGFQVSPAAGTIFHKSETSLRSWFFAIYLFSQSKNGVSAMELKRQLGVTYKTAWRMAKQIRTLFSGGGGKLYRIVEADETYIGGRAEGKRGRGAENKTAVFGLVQREGELRAEVVPNTKAATLLPIMRKNVRRGSRFMTDHYGAYNKVRSMGYYHRRINHGINQYVRGITHVNTIEGFWSQLKRSINGTYHAVSPKHLQSYVDEFSWRYNARRSLSPLFELLMEKLAA